MTAEQIKRAAALYAAVEAKDKEIKGLLVATEISLYGRVQGSPLGEFKRTRNPVEAEKREWPNETAARLHHILVVAYTNERNRHARELRQMGLSVPEAPQ